VLHILASVLVVFWGSLCRCRSTRAWRCYCWRSLVDKECYIWSILFHVYKSCFWIFGFPFFRHSTFKRQCRLVCL